VSFPEHKCMCLTCCLALSTAARVCRQKQMGGRAGRRKQLQQSACELWEYAAGADLLHARPARVTRKVVALNICDLSLQATDIQSPAAASSSIINSNQAALLGSAAATVAVAAQASLLTLLQLVCSASVTQYTAAAAASAAEPHLLAIHMHTGWVPAAGTAQHAQKGSLVPVDYT
jgi:hypothetical protein